MKRALFLVGVVLLWGLASIWVAFADDNHPSVGRSVADFRLADQSGRPMTRQSLAGHVWIADFIFTRCPDACWNMTQTLVGLQDLLRRHADLRFVSFSIDPEYDTPAVLSDYARKAHVSSSRWSFLTGPMSTIASVAHSFLLATLTPDMDILSHSTEFAVVDRDGVIRGYYDLDVPAEVAAMPKRVESLLQR